MTVCLNDDLVLTKMWTMGFCRTTLSLLLLLRDIAILDVHVITINQNDLANHFLFTVYSESIK